MGVASKGRGAREERKNRREVEMKEGERWKR